MSDADDSTELERLEAENNELRLGNGWLFQRHITVATVAEKLALESLEKSNLIDKLVGEMVDLKLELEERKRQLSAITPDVKTAPEIPAGYWLAPAEASVYMLASAAQSMRRAPTPLEWKVGEAAYIVYQGMDPGERKNKFRTTVVLSALQSAFEAMRDSYMAGDVPILRADDAKH